ncbi:hypothetical protein CD798_09845 [Bacillaceae bacterium SAOS 7]|nr:hypothetical protein CD798_09845 [Bacillaceae bacterium SAOS 7]
MISIDTKQTIEVVEVIYDRITNIISIAEQYGMKEVIVQNLTINVSKDNSKIEYNLNVKKAKFPDYPLFQMKLNEAAYTTDKGEAVTYLKSYSYQGFHIENKEDAKKHFIRFDFEPFKKKYAPVHINAPEQEWGDHLTYPDSTNLDISKMSFPIAVEVFHRYAKDKNDYPVNEKTNMHYVEIFENGGKDNERIEVKL